MLMWMFLWQWVPWCLSLLAKAKQWAEWLGLLSAAVQRYLNAYRLIRIQQKEEKTQLLHQNQV
jgi:uncharacterized membrane protein (DUF2068 family)